MPVPVTRCWNISAVTCFESPSTTAASNLSLMAMSPSATETIALNRCIGSLSPEASFSNASFNISCLAVAPKSVTTEFSRLTAATNETMPPHCCLLPCRNRHRPCPRHRHYRAARFAKTEISSASRPSLPQGVGPLERISAATSRIQLQRHRLFDVSADFCLDGRFLLPTPAPFRHSPRPHPVQKQHEVRKRILPDLIANPKHRLKIQTRTLKLAV